MPADAPSPIDTTPALLIKAIWTDLRLLVQQRLALTADVMQSRARSARGPAIASFVGVGVLLVSGGELANAISLLLHGLGSPPPIEDTAWLSLWQSHGVVAIAMGLTGLALIAWGGRRLMAIAAPRPPLAQGMLDE